MSYFYKVTGKKVTLADGTRANVAKFAFKPYRGWGDDVDRLNARMYRENGCHRAEAYVDLPTYTGRVVLGNDLEVVIRCDRGVFSDDWFDREAKRQREKN
jgi:hypothetical protein